MQYQVSTKMSITSFIKKVCVQTAVYWGNPQNDGYGGTTFDYPVEIKCRWEDKERIQYSNMGKELHQKGEALITQDVDIQGWLYLGTLDDFDSSVDETDPLHVDGAYQIIAIDKIPLIKSTTEFVRKVMFGFGNVQN